MNPGFRLFLRLCSQSAGPDARAFWNHVSSRVLDPEDRAAIARVEARRRQLESDNRTIARTDYGAGSRRERSRGSGSVSVGHLARKASVSRTWGRMLFHTARVAGSRAILELGSCVGVSAAYLQAALDRNGGGAILTVEGDPLLCAVAVETLGSVSGSAGTVVEGRFEDVLPSIGEKHDPFDLVFIDGHHDPLAVETYLGMILPHLTGNAIVILDDVQPLTGAVRPAWKGFVRTLPATWCVDLIRMGVFRMTPAQ